MANLMGITNPAPVYDSASNNALLAGANKGQQNAPIHNIIDPSKVTRADARVDKDSSNSSQVRFESNLQAFVEQMRAAPDLAEQMTKIIQLLRSTVATPGLDAGVANEISQFLQLLTMDEGQFKDFFLSQMGSKSRFTGPLFALLRQAYNSTNAQGTKEAILNFVKRFSDFSQTAHISNGILANLKDIEANIPESWRTLLSQYTNELQEGFLTGTRSQNLDILQNKIIPHLSSYIERTHDMGNARDILSLLLLSVARYENGAEDAMLAAFRQMSSFSEILSQLSEIDSNDVLRLLQSGEYVKSVQEDEFAKRFSLAANQALGGQYGTDAKDVFSQIIKALLINESVYMPLNHVMLPVDFNGNMMYSEMWVDPDAHKEGRGEGENGQNKMQFLCKLDLQNLGFMEMAFSVRQDNVEMQIFAPEVIAKNSETVAKDIREILSSHGFNSKEVAVEKLITPLAITQVFPNLLEGRQGVNVKI